MLKIDEIIFNFLVKLNIFCFKIIIIITINENIPKNNLLMFRSTFQAPYKVLGDFKCCIRELERMDLLIIINKNNYTYVLY